MLLLESNIPININQTDREKGWTALHYAFYHSQGFKNHREREKTEEYVTQRPHIKAVELLLSKGADSLRDKRGHTPLMCFRRDASSLSFGTSLICRYSPFEANYHGVAPKLYENALLEVKRGYTSFMAFRLFNTKTCQQNVSASSTFNPGV